VFGSRFRLILISASPRAGSERQEPSNNMLGLAQLRRSPQIFPPQSTLHCTDIGVVLSQPNLPNGLFEIGDNSHAPKTSSLVSLEYLISGDGVPDSKNK
jgi:hypothetical protein